MPAAVVWKKPISVKPNFLLMVGFSVASEIAPEAVDSC